MLSSNPKCKKAVMSRTEKIHVLDKLCSGVSYIVLLAVSSVLMNQQHIFNKVPLNRNMHKTRLLKM